ncbi:anthranilate synthase component II [Afifella sp. YEN Y35]|uniref:anthranilate synthase component II n=1 Tax=Afifella sp. YEN Y35 TaxID=3388337 RepID=UPI0039DFE583
MLIVIDNYDSFTWNLVHYLGELGAETKVLRNDEWSTEDVLAAKPEGIILSPGPCTPNEAGISLDLIKKANGQMPIFGVCLGHQAIGQAYGGEVVRAPSLMHGKLSLIEHEGAGVFHGINGPFQATRYHSLTILPESMPESLEVTAHTADGVIMGVQHRSHPVYGVQFHPESIASEHGHRILDNFLKLAASFRQTTGAAEASPKVLS